MTIPSHSLRVSSCERAVTNRDGPVFPTTPRPPPTGISMRELDRDSISVTPACTRLAIVGRGRLGTALARALRARSTPAGSSLEVVGPLGRGAPPGGVDAILLCVPDGQIAAAAALIAP